MICLFCNCKCKKYEVNLNERFIHYKCPFEFIFHNYQNLMTFKTNKYRFAFYLSDDFSTIEYGEIFLIKNNEFININMSGILILEFLKEKNFNYINNKFEELLIYA